MKFTTDELSPFSEVRKDLSQFVAAAQTGKEVVVTKHGQPIAGIVSAQALYRYRELDRLMGQLVAAVSESGAFDGAAIHPAISTALEQIRPLLDKPIGGNDA